MVELSLESLYQLIYVNSIFHSIIKLLTLWTLKVDVVTDMTYVRSVFQNSWNVRSFFDRCHQRFSYSVALYLYETNNFSKVENLLEKNAHMNTQNKLTQYIFFTFVKHLLVCKFIWKDLLCCVIFIFVKMKTNSSFVL